MESRNIDHQVVVERGSGTGMGVVLGVILAIVVLLAVMWFAFGANRFGAATSGGSQSTTNNGPDINITVPKPDVNINIVPTVGPIQPPAAVPKP